MQVSTNIMRSRQDTIRYNWGFRFALWCALLWGVCYQSVGFLLQGDTFMGLEFTQRDPVFSGLALAVILSAAITIVGIAWVVLSGNRKEYLTMILQFKRENLLYLLCALSGGSIAWLTYVVVSMLDTTFALGMAMFYPIIGSVIARLWYREKVSRQCVIGLALLLLGFIVFYLPATLSSQGSTPLFSLGLGVLVGLGWGIESTLAARAMDVSDSDVGVAVRFTYELVIWLVVLLLITLFGGDIPLTAQIVTTLGDPWSLMFIAAIALCLTFNYFAWYKSFVLCGVCRGLAVSDISGFLSVILGMALATAQPDLFAVLACVLMMVGIFIIYYGQAHNMAVLRDVNLSPVSDSLQRVRKPENLPIKALALAHIAEQGGDWDYQLADSLTADLPLSSRQRQRRRKQIRLALIEAAAGGLIAPTQDCIDDGSYFSADKLLSYYALTVFGQERLETMGIAAATVSSNRHEEG